MGSFAHVDPQLLELSSDGRTVTRKPPRSLHEHACALGGTVLKEGCHRWEVTLDRCWEERGGMNICVGVAAAGAKVKDAPQLPVPTGFPDQGIVLDGQGVASLAVLPRGETDQGEEWDAWPAELTEAGGKAPAAAAAAAAATSGKAAGGGGAAAWGFNPYDAALYTCADARQWGQHARALRPAGQPAVRATRVTVIVHMGAPAKRGGPPPRRSLSFAVDGGPEMEAAGVELPAAVVPWVLLHHAGDTVSLGPSERLERAPVPEASAPTEARTRWDELARDAEAEEAAVRAGWGEALPQTQQAVVEELMGGLDEDREAMVNEEAEARKADAERREEARGAEERAQHAARAREAEAMEEEAAEAVPALLGRRGTEEEDEEEAEDEEAEVVLKTPYARRKRQAALAGGAAAEEGGGGAGGWRFRSWDEVEAGGEEELATMLQQTAAMFEEVDREQAAAAATEAATPGAAATPDAAEAAPAAAAATPAAANPGAGSGKKKRSGQKKAAPAEQEQVDEPTATPSSEAPAPASKKRAKRQASAK